MNRPEVKAKTNRERSWFRVTLAGGTVAIIAIIAEYLLKIADVLALPEPWDSLVPLLIGLAVAVAKGLQEQTRNPSVDPRKLPTGTVRVLDKDGNSL